MRSRKIENSYPLRIEKTRRFQIALRNVLKSIRILHILYSQHSGEMSRSLRILRYVLLHNNSKTKIEIYRNRHCVSIPVFPHCSEKYEIILQTRGLYDPCRETWKLDESRRCLQRNDRTRFSARYYHRWLTFDGPSKISCRASRLRTENIKKKNTSIVNLIHFYRTAFSVRM